MYCTYLQTNTFNMLLVWSKVLVCLWNYSLYWSDIGVRLNINILIKLRRVESTANKIKASEIYF